MSRLSHRCALAVLLIYALVSVRAVHAQRDTTTRMHGDSVTIHLVDVDIRAAVQALSQYLDRPVVFGAVNGGRVTLETPRPIARSGVLPLLRSTLESQNLELVSDSAGSYRVRAKEAPRPPAPEPSRQLTASGPTQLFVIHLSHARAADVAATVNALYGRASALGELGSTPPSLGQQLTQNYQNTQSQLFPQAQQPMNTGLGAGISQPTTRSATLTGETTIIPDASTNSLLIRASQSDFELISAAVKEIDVRPLQVLIEVLIAEVRRDRSFEFGVDVNVPPAHYPKGSDRAISASQTGLGLGDLVISVMGIGGDKDAVATLRAAASRGDAKILSRPAIIAANNEQAQILVGSQRPFVQVSRSLPTDAASRDQVVQYKDVGTKLVVRPTISTDGYVMLEVSQEVSAATSETQFDAPVISTRAVQTRLLLKDGQSVVIGGLSDRQRELTQGGVPILSSIPILGGLFGRVSQTSTTTELFLFITPRIIRSDADAEALTKPLQEKANRQER